MALNIIEMSSWPAELVRNLKRTAAKPTPQPVTVAYSAVDAPTSSRTTDSEVCCMAAPDGCPGPAARGWIADGQTVLDSGPGGHDEFENGGQPRADPALWTC